MMEYQTNPYLVWQIIPALITGWLGIYIRNLPRKKRESDSFAILMFAAAIWSLGNGIQWISPNTTWQIFWNAVTYIGIVIIPTAWFLLAVKFTGYLRAQVEKIENLFLVFPALIYLAVITNDYHKLIFSSFNIQVIDNFTTVEGNWGSVLYINTYYSYILITLGILLIVIGLFTNLRSYGRYAFGLIIGVYVFKGFRTPRPDSLWRLFAWLIRLYTSKLQVQLAT